MEDLLLRSSPRGNRNDSAQTWRAERDREILAAAVMSHLGRRRCCWCWWWWRLSKCLLSDTSSLCRLSVFCVVVFCFGLCFFFPLCPAVLQADRLFAGSAHPRSVGPVCSTLCNAPYLLRLGNQSNLLIISSSLHFLLSSLHHSLSAPLCT